MRGLRSSSPPHLCLGPLFGSQALQFFVPVSTSSHNSRSLPPSPNHRPFRTLFVFSLGYVSRPRPHPTRSCSTPRRNRRTGIKSSRTPRTPPAGACYRARARSFTAPRGARAPNAAAVAAPATPPSAARSSPSTATPRPSSRTTSAPAAARPSPPPTRRATPWCRARAPSSRRTRARPARRRRAGRRAARRAPRAVPPSVRTFALWVAYVPPSPAHRSIYPPGHSARSSCPLHAASSSIGIAHPLARPSACSPLALPLRCLCVA